MKLTTIFSALLSARLVSAALDEKIKTKGKKYFGNVLDLNTIDDDAITDILKAEFGSITPENSWKWGAVQHVRGTFDFTAADMIANWAIENGKLLQGHVLAWHSQLPSWVHRIEDAEDLKSIIETHITTMVGRYKGKIDSWHVVNEVLTDSGDPRDSVFYRVLGEEFIDIAFHAAKAADPGAKLYINEYGLEVAGPKVDALIALVERLSARGVPIDGIGTQSHILSGTLKNYGAQLQALADTGLEVAITELDIRIEEPVTPEKEEQQAKDFKEVTKACLKVEKCVGITLWGVSDNYSWVTSVLPGLYADPLLWDDYIAQKAAYDAVDTALD
ncbi:glycosyl hydrolase family 10 protein [Coprinopsis sp. MPI-PUGE-AT-0042]|nr:glycosyl hydrolase family 10 protein [Coprinopsis sp. MPI-PUGE-AT-0042]